MALNKDQLKNDIFDMLHELAIEDNQDVSILMMADKLATAIDTYVKGATIEATPAQVTTATMTAGGYPVTAAHNLQSTIT